MGRWNNQERSEQEGSRRDNKWFGEFRTATEDPPPGRGWCLGLEDRKGSRRDPSPSGLSHRFDFEVPRGQGSDAVSDETPLGRP